MSASALEIELNNAERFVLTWLMVFGFMACMLVRLLLPCSEVHHESRLLASMNGGGTAAGHLNKQCALACFWSIFGHDSRIHFFLHSKNNTCDLREAIYFATYYLLLPPVAVTMFILQ